MKKILFSLLAFLALPWLSLANGDPVISYSANIRSCNPVPLKVSEVQVVSEKLDIDVKIPYTSVRVSYRLKNASAKPIRVDYGFPVDFSGKADDADAFLGDEWTESIYEGGIAGRAVRDVHFRLDGAELKWTRSDTIVKTGESYEDEEGEKIDIEMCRLWTYTVLDIPAGETMTLEVEYSVLSNWDVPLGALKASPLSRYFASSGRFMYDFTPAQHWGNGKADHLSLKLDCSALPASFFHEDSPVLNTRGPYVTYGKKVWSLNAANFDFATADQIRLDYWESYEEKDAYTSWGDPLKTCAVPSSQYRVSVSGAQDKYPAGNMLDGDLSTAWVAPGDGIGATVDIDFPTPCRVSDLGFYNGYHKSASLWAANSRIKRLLLEVTRADGYQEGPVEIDVSYWDEKYYTLSDDSVPRFGRISLIPLTTLLRQAYGRDKGSDEDGIIIREKVPFSSEYISHIRLKVLAVSPGTKYSDLCLSELVVLDGFKLP